MNTTKEILGEKFEKEVALRLRRILPPEAIILSDMYFLTGKKIPIEPFRLSVQIDIIVILNGVFSIECKYLSDSKYHSLRNCSSSNAYYNNRLSLYKNQNGQVVRIKKSLYGLNQNESHTNYLRKILNDEFGKVTVTGITVIGGLRKDKLQAKYQTQRNYIKHEDDFYSYILNAISNWEFNKIDERKVADYLISKEWIVADRKQKHIAQVEYCRSKY